MNQALPLGPRTAALNAAFASALSGPRWVHGQRLPAQPHAYIPKSNQHRGRPQAHVHPYGQTHARLNHNPNTNAMYPPTPSLSFPISLNHRDDPFSRAVSPIHGDLDLNIEFPHTQMFSAHGMKDADELLFMPTPNMNRVPDPDDVRDPNPNLSLTTDIDDEMGVSDDPFNVLDFDPPGPPIDPHIAVPHAQVFSAPPSPRQPNDWSALRAATFQRPSSTGSVDLSNTHHNPSTSAGQNQPYPFNQSQSYKWNQGQITNSPRFVALKKIRRPSLRTLLSTGGSQGPSPVQSPTLFDQPMQMDDAVEAVSSDMWGQTGTGPFDGGVGDSNHFLRGSEGLGMMSFDGMMPIQN